MEVNSRGIFNEEEKQDSLGNVLFSLASDGGGLRSSSGQTFSFRV